jgi:predicted hydrolase (HD superfamily)
MLTLAEAEALLRNHLGSSSRATHSRFVAYMMRRLAEAVGGNTIVWELTGLCHDLDFNAVAGDWSQHGIVAASWLDGALPAEALDAIRAHDHRAGVQAETAIANALKLADALAVIAAELGAAETSTSLRNGDSSGELSRHLSGRPWLTALVTDNAAALGVPLPELANLIASAPPAA